MADAMNITENNKSTTTRVLKYLVKHIEYAGTGRWIYTRHVMQWASDREIVAQLPLGLRLFCRYCKWYMHIFQFRTIIFGHGVFAICKLISRDRIRPITKLQIGKLPIYLDLRDPGSLWTIQELSGRSTQREALEHLLEDGCTYLDVGANQGAFTTIAADLIGEKGNIIAIEPQANLAQCIRQTLKAIDGPKWAVHQCGVGDRCYQANLLVPGENSGEAHISSTLERHSTTSTILIQTLDILFTNSFPLGRCLVKMDIEGSEVNALIGGYNFFTKYKPTLMLEINPIALSRFQSNVKELIDTLGKLGYSSWSKLEQFDYKQSLSCIPTNEYLDILV